MKALGFYRSDLQSSAVRSVKFIASQFQRRLNQITLASAGMPEGTGESRNSYASDGRDNAVMDVDDSDDPANSVGAEVVLGALFYMSVLVCVAILVRGRKE
jgi:hypothetical protein